MPLLDHGPNRAGAALLRNCGYCSWVNAGSDFNRAGGSAPTPLWVLWWGKNAGSDFNRAGGGAPSHCGCCGEVKTQDPILIAPGAALLRIAGVVVG